MNIKWKALFSLLLSVCLLLGLMSLPRAAKASLPIAHADGTGDAEITLGDFESTNETWDFLIGSGGSLGNGEFTRDAEDAQSGNQSGKLQLNFGVNSWYRYSYATLEKYLFKRILPVDANVISFWVKTEDVSKFDIVLLDHSNQNHQQTIQLAASSEWQKVTVDSFTSGTGYTKWGGSNDGVWHGPLKKITIKLTGASMKTSNKEGTIRFDNLHALVTPPDLEISQQQVGNVFTGNRTALFKVLTRGDAVHWSAENAWGDIAAEGDAAISGGSQQIAVTVPEDGYYKLHLTALEGGDAIKKMDTTFAVLPEFDSGAAGDSPFGIQTHFGINWNKEMIPLLSSTGVSNVRDSFYWSEVELNQGQYTFTPKTSLPMQSFQEFGLNPFLVFAFGNPYYDSGLTPYTEEAHLAYANYVMAMLQKFGSQLHEGEIWNEFNLPYFGGSGPAASRAEVYFELLKKSYEAIKSSHPDFEVVGGATAGVPLDWLEELFQLGGLAYMDSLSVHPYRYPDTPEGLIAEIEGLQSLIETYGNGKQVPIRFSEIGWPTHNNPTGVDEMTQAAYLIRSYLISIFEGVEQIYWYNLMNSGTDKLSNEDNFGIVHHTGDALGAYTPKPGYVALSTLTRQLAGAEPVAHSEQDGIYHYSYTKDGEPLHVLWSLQKRDVVLSSGEPLAVTDMMGRTQIYSPWNGKIYLNLSGEPQFVQGNLDAVAGGSPFSLSDATVLTRDPIRLTLQVNSLEDEVVASTSFQGEIRSVNIPAAGSYEVEFQAKAQPGEWQASSLLTVNGVAVGRLTAKVAVLDSENVSSKHVLRGGEDVIAITLKNERELERTLTHMDWEIGTATGSIDYDDSIEGGGEMEINFLLAEVPQDSLLPYQFTLQMGDGAILTTSGTVQHVPAADRVQLPYRSLETMSDIEGLASIDLVADVHSRIADQGDAEDFSGKLWVAYDDEQFYLYARVHDDVYSQPNQDDRIWAGDSIQFAVSAGMPGEESQWYEYGMSLTDQGTVLYRWLAPQGHVTGPVESGDVTIVRDEENKDTLYQLALPWEELGPIVPDDGLLSLSIVVNENDSGLRRGYVEWGSGIGSSKQASLFKPMELQPPDLDEPLISITGVEDGGDYTDQAMPVIEVTDAGSGLKLRSFLLNEAEWIGASPITANGAYRLRVYAEDYAGNASAAEATFRIYGSTVLQLVKPELHLKQGGIALKARLTDSNGTGIEGQSISFFISSLRLGSALTNANGEATLLSPVKNVKNLSDFKLPADWKAVYEQNEEFYWRGSEDTATGRDVQELGESGK
ncbi:hypothetical protein M6D81_09130 [Paenibacillus sp. J5C_2022]|uniref:sugar-binding protein n=1 Tax=Paenibacillus sp. J5C2022 TaxID=2977129 RepID=UPI0021CE9B79|nr:sugar-binding protein [Paenibacillus sp. J5C2022]MCU6708882.1 hypothetical protein [Paenibacillus sp. J5C2022]